MPAPGLEGFGAGSHAEDDASPAAAGAASEDAEESSKPSAAPPPSMKNGARPGWYVWGASLALVGIFIAAFSHDLSNEEAPPAEGEKAP